MVVAKHEWASSLDRLSIPHLNFSLFSPLCHLWLQIDSSVDRLIMELFRWDLVLRTFTFVHTIEQVKHFYCLLNLLKVDIPSRYLQRYQCLDPHHILQ